MSNDNGLIDEFEKLQVLKRELGEKEEELKNKIIMFAQDKKTDLLFGTKIKCSIKEYPKIVYPDDKTPIIELMKQKGIYDNYTTLNYLRLNSAIIKGQVDKEVTQLTKQEKAFRLSLKEI